MTHDEFILKVFQKYGDTIEIVSEYKGINNKVDFIYKCKHGETKHATRAANLTRSGKLSCFCFRCQYPNRDKVYVGAKFGYWTVIDDSYSDNVCMCQCQCGTIKEVDNYTLITQTSTNCGCYRHSKEFAETIGKVQKKYNDYVICDKYVIMYTSNNEPFLVDIEDFGKVKDVCWSKNNRGYLVGYVGNGNTVMLHRYIMDCPKGMEVDHKYGSDTKFDNRRSNLRICTRAENLRNTKISSANTSDYKGVYWNKKRKMWVAQISIGINPKNGKKKTYYLGSYQNKEDAIKAREEAERKYFGEYSYTNSRLDVKGA